MPGSNRNVVAQGYGIPADDDSILDFEYKFLNGSINHEPAGSRSYASAQSVDVISLPDVERSSCGCEVRASNHNIDGDGYGTFSVSLSTTDSLYRYFEDVEDAGDISYGIASTKFFHPGWSNAIPSDAEDDYVQGRKYSFAERWGVNAEFGAVSSVDNTSIAAGFGTSQEVPSDIRGEPSDADFYSDATFQTPLVRKKAVGSASTPLVAWNLLNSVLGTSILALPFAVYSGGYIVFGFIIGVALISMYTSKIVISMMYERSARYRRLTVRTRLDYAELGQDVFDSPSGALLIRVIQLLEMFAICVLNICVLAQLCHEIFPKVGIKACTAIAAVVALPTFFIRALAVIGWLQTFGVLSLGIGLILVEGYCVSQASSWKLSNLCRYELDQLPISVGILVYAFGVQGVMPGMEQQMSNPKRFGAVVNVTFMVAVVVQFLFSFSNAMLYGQVTKQVITIDLKNHFALGVASACFIALSILCNFSLPTFIVMEHMDLTVHRLLPCCPSHSESRHHTLLTVSLRVLIMALSAGLAMLLPYFAFLMGLVGSGITVLTALVMPCCFHLRLRGTNAGFLYVALDIAIIIFGVACMGFGTFFSFKAIYKDAFHHITDV